MNTASHLTQPVAAPAPAAPLPAQAPPAPSAAPATHAGPGAPAATAPWVVALLGGLSGVVGMALCVGAGVLVWVRPGVMDPLTAALTMGGFLVGGAALFVSVVAVRRR